jgi:hypothetical protein
MRKQLIIELLLLLSLIFNQSLSATAFAHLQDFTDSHIKEYTPNTLDSNDCPEHSSAEQAVDKCTQHTSCYCPAMSVHCSSSAFFSSNTGYLLLTSSLPYFARMQASALHSRSLGVELRPPKITP